MQENCQVGISSARNTKSAFAEGNIANLRHCAEFESEDRVHPKLTGRGEGTPLQQP
jgi:hypothetical protein